MNATAFDPNPQAEQMASAAMARILDVQARAIWPQETSIMAHYDLPTTARILDAGCGTGEGSIRLAEYFPQAEVLGVDIMESNLAQARTRFDHFAPRLTFAARSVFDLQLVEQSFDLTVCRHVLQSIPQPRAAIAELARVTKPGGYLHFIAEDYGMIHFERGDRDLQALWHKVCNSFATASDIDLCVGRHIYRMLTEAHLESVAVNYIAVDPLRVPRNLIAAIFEGWRDGFAEVAARYIGMPPAAVLEHFNAMVAQARDPRCYVVWMVPVVSARIPAFGG